MDQDRAPFLDALADYQRLDRYGFTPPGHRHGRGADPRTLEVLGIEPFRSDVLASSGLDDRASSGKILETAEELMADAVHLPLMCGVDDDPVSDVSFHGRLQGDVSSVTACPCEAGRTRPLPSAATALSAAGFLCGLAAGVAPGPVR